MTRRISIPLIALSLLAAVAIGQFSPGLPRATGEQAKAAPKWEYAMLQVGNQPVWITAEGSLYARDWADLAGRLKVPNKPKDANGEVAKVIVLNYLASQGWELVTHAVSPRDHNLESHHYTFKRQAP